MAYVVNDARCFMTWQLTRYKCDNCGLGFPRWKAITTKDDKHILCEDSLQWHLIASPECNEYNANRTKRYRQERYQREREELSEYL